MIPGRDRTLQKKKKRWRVMRVRCWPLFAGSCPKTTHPKCRKLAIDNSSRGSRKSSLNPGAYVDSFKPEIRVSTAAPLQSAARFEPQGGNLWFGGRRVLVGRKKAGVARFC